MKVGSHFINDEDIFLHTISGSNAYGLATPQSDTDIKGVFILPKNEYYGLNYTEQINGETNDTVFYELKRFFELLLKNNPNILELIGSPPECVLYQHPLANKLKPSLFLSKLCRQTFVQYAETQIKKARGLNKKIVNPIAKERKTIADFCFVVEGQRTISLQTWLTKNNYAQQNCGLVNLAHMKDTYALFCDIDVSKKYRGIYSDEKSNDVLLSSIPVGEEPKAIMSFNKDGYSVYCREYKEYWDWVEKRNDTRYQSTLTHGKNYDAKNMMHVFRLLNMAEDIASKGEIVVKRPERDFLLDIKQGSFVYEDLLVRANEKIILVNELFDKCSLPDEPDKNVINNLLIEIREEFYSSLSPIS